MVNPGVTSDFGFTYQRLVYIYNMVVNCNSIGDSFSYEILDDVSSSATTKDELCKISYEKTIIQCKTGHLSYEIFIKVIENWLLLDFEQFTHFVLCSEEDIDFEIDLNVLFDTIKENVLNYYKKERKRSDSILYKIGKIYGESEETFNNQKFKDDLNCIIRHFSKEINNYVQLLEKCKNAFASRECVDCKSNETIINTRFETLISKINKTIDLNESKRMGTVVSFFDYKKYIVDIVQTINDKVPYHKDYIAFKKNKINALKNDNELMGSREALFLKDVLQLEDNKVFEYLLFEYYYRDLRDFYTGLNENDKNEETDYQVKDAYNDVVPNPDIKIHFNDVINKITNMNISLLQNAQYKKGTLMYLSGDDCLDDYYIDWNGKNAK